MRDGGKGDSQRPLGVDLEQFDNNWDAIFCKTKKGQTRGNYENPVMLYGFTEEETNETSSVKGLSK